MTRSNRSLPAASDLAVKENTFTKGREIVIAASAGTKLAGKRGVVVGKGTTKSQVRVLLEGSKNYITLHARFVSPGESR